MTAVRYKAPDDYALDVEVYPLTELRRRVGDADARGLERIDFHCLIYLGAGRYAHMVDFELEKLLPGSLLFLRPGQVHRFGDLAGCQGWLLVFKAELLPSRDDVPADAGARALPTHLRLSAPARRAVTETLERMASDAHGSASRALNILLRCQVQSLLLRLRLEQAPGEADDRFDPVVWRRYRRFRDTLERDFASCHAVAPYAARLGCSEKSLTRAALAVTDRSAKAVITERLVLESKRLLAHTLLPVAAIGDQLGFAEPTNFVKFFRREVGATPGAFRAAQRSHAPKGATSGR